LGSSAVSTYEALTTLYRRISQSALDLAYATDNTESNIESSSESNSENNNESNSENGENSEG
jgi:hypothetical protein